MKHCQRCRDQRRGASAEDRSAEFRGCLEACSEEVSLRAEGRPYVAGASLEGMLVNQHPGEASNGGKVYVDATLFLGEEFLAHHLRRA